MSTPHEFYEAHKLTELYTMIKNLELEVNYLRKKIASVESILFDNNITAYDPLDMYRDTILD